MEGLIYKIVANNLRIKYRIRMITRREVLFGKLVLIVIM